MNYLDLVQSAVVGTYSAGLAVAAVCGKLLYWATVPFSYPAYYLWAVLSFVLSPLWFLVDLVRSATLLVLHLAVRFRYVYIYFTCATIIGLLAACALHGTSSLLFMVLRVHPSQQPAPAPALIASQGRSREPGQRMSGEDEENDYSIDADDDFDLGGSSTRETATATSSGLTSASTSDAPVLVRNRRGRESSSLGDLYGNHWRTLSDHRKAPVKARHRGKLKGLLAQTIHEESSESESL